MTDDDGHHLILNSHMAYDQVNKKSKTAKITAFFYFAANKYNEQNNLKKY